MEPPGGIFALHSLLLVLTLFVIPGNMTTDQRMKRISAPGSLPCFRIMPDRENPFNPPIRCHISEPQNSLESTILTQEKSHETRRFF